MYSELDLPKCPLFTPFMDKERESVSQVYPGQEEAKASRALGSQRSGAQSSPGAPEALSSPPPPSKSRSGGGV